MSLYRTTTKPTYAIWLVVELNPTKSGIALSQKKQIYVKDTEGEHEAPL